MSSSYWRTYVWTTGGAVALQRRMASNRLDSVVWTAGVDFGTNGFETMALAS